MSGLIVVDRALFDVGELVHEAAVYLARRLGGNPPLDPTSLPRDAGAALRAIDDWAGSAAANWRAENTRWYEAHAPVRLIPDTELNAALRRARRGGLELELVSVLPQEPLDLVAGHLGVARAFGGLHGGDGDLEAAIAQARASLGTPGAEVVDRRAALLEVCSNAS